MYIDCSGYRLKEIDEIQAKIRNQLGQYCMNLKTENFEVYLFAQIFVT